MGKRGASRKLRFAVAEKIHGLYNSGLSHRSRCSPDACSFSGSASSRRARVYQSSVARVRSRGGRSCMKARSCPSRPRNIDCSICYRFVRRNGRTDVRICCCGRPCKVSCPHHSTSQAIADRITFGRRQRVTDSTPDGRYGRARFGNRTLRAVPAQPMPSAVPETQAPK